LICLFLVTFKLENWWLYYNPVRIKFPCLEVSKLNRSKNLRTEDPLKTKKKILVNKKKLNKGKKRKIYSICYGSNCPAFKFYVKKSEQLNAWSFYKCDFIKKTSHQKRIECHNALNGKLKKTNHGNVPINIRNQNRKTLVCLCIWSMDFQKNHTPCYLST